MTPLLRPCISHGTPFITTDLYIIPIHYTYILQCVFQEALKTGVDLRHYSQEVERELAAVESASITDYIGESVKIAQLHGEMKQCDSILGLMEQMLGTFQQDLVNITCSHWSLHWSRIVFSYTWYLIYNIYCTWGNGKDLWHLGAPNRS